MLSLSCCTFHIHSYDKLFISSLCIFSENLNQEVILNYNVKKKQLTIPKTNFNPSVKTILYFSDGCAALSKNCKHFINLWHQITNYFVSIDFITLKIRQVCLTGSYSDNYLLFVIYINDLSDYLSINAKLFGDDTSLFSVMRDINTSTTH